MFLLDSLMVAGIRWALETTRRAAEAEMDDEVVLREQLLVAEMSRECGDISDVEFAAIERDLLDRIRFTREHARGDVALSLTGLEPMETTGDHRVAVEASLAGDFHQPVDAPRATVAERGTPHRSRRRSAASVPRRQEAEGPAPRGGTIPTARRARSRRSARGRRA